MYSQNAGPYVGPIHYEKPLYCKEGTCSFCFKPSQLCFEFEPTLDDDWSDENNKPILCQECDDLCWIHERPVINTPQSACVCELREEANEEPKEEQRKEENDEIQNDEIHNDQIQNDQIQNDQIQPE
jgi:hypothetical protein